MGVSRQRLNYFLRQAKKKVPQFFPILTPFQNRVYRAKIITEFTRYGLAQYLGCGVKKVDNTIQQLRKKHYCHTQLAVKTVFFQEFMSDSVRQKF